MPPPSPAPITITDAFFDALKNANHPLVFAYQGLLELAIMLGQVPGAVLYAKTPNQIALLAKCKIDAKTETLHTLAQLTEQNDTPFLWLSTQENSNVFNHITLENTSIQSATGIRFPLAIDVTGYLFLFDDKTTQKHNVQIDVMHRIIQQIKLLFEAQMQQMELLHEQKKYKALLQISGDGVHVFDRQGDVVDINERFCEMLGYSREELMTMNVADWDAMFTPELLADKVEATFNEPAIFETRHKRKDGNIIDVEISAQPIWIDGKLYLWNASRDISVRKNTERLKHGFISTVNHELRTPATSIIGSLTLVLKSMADTLPPQVKTLLQIAHRNSERLVYLINDILDMEKLQANAMPFYIEKLPIADLIAQSLVDTKSYGDKYNVDYNFVNQVGDLAVQLDKQRFMQVMANLISNAYKFSQTGSHIDVHVSLVDNLCRITIQDYGMGIPDEFKSKIFMPFSQADTSDARAKGGSGLGLSITKTIVEKMKGTIGFESVLHQGTVFFVDFPVS